MKVGRESASGCPVCGERGAEPVVTIERVPVFCNVLWETREEALAAPRGDLSLVHCSCCGHFFNEAFDPALTEYSPGYENSLHFSERFNQYARDLVDRLVQTYDLRGKDLVEVGCGEGDFLRMLVEAGGNRGVGFDPARSASTTVLDMAGDEAAADLRFVSEALTPDCPRLPVDFLCCRHVLEHIADPLAFLRDVRGWMGSEGDGVVYLEVPNALHTIERSGIWDLIYEHVSYFTSRSLVSLLRRAGFAPHDWGEVFGGQYLFAEARVVSRAAEQVARARPDESTEAAAVESFRIRFEARVEAWRARFREEAQSGAAVVLWGGGSKGVTLLNLTEPGPVVRAVVDVNPRKQGRFVPGTGHEVVPPTHLLEAAPETVIVTNALYLREIEKEIERMGLDARLELA